MKQLIFFCCIIFLTCCSTNERQTGELPPIFPDYAEVTIPCNIAPLNFTLTDENVSSMKVTIQGEGKSIMVRGKKTHIPSGKWNKLISENETLTISVSAKKDGEWIRYAPFNIFISKDMMDDYICYRRIDPGYATYNKMGIYQRDLTSYKEEAIIENTLLELSCLNCHSFRQCSPNSMQFHIRGKNGGTVIMEDDLIKKIKGRAEGAISACVYPYYHPSGKYIVYSVNKTKQNFHNTPHHILDVYDEASDIVLYDIQKDTILFFPTLSDSTKFETFPSFSPDGKSIYFCCAEAKDPNTQLTEIKYSLCSIAFNPETAQLEGEIKTIYDGDGGSATFPRPSYDGKYLIFTRSQYGTFPIWHKDADLYLLDIATGEVRTIDEVNSDNTESYHSWSANSHWIVFSSRRIDGLHTRPFIAHIDSNGVFSKPFLVPQKDPSYYEKMLQSFNIPEFVSSKVKFNTSKFRKVLKDS